jgi:hypothetical protein
MITWLGIYSLHMLFPNVLNSVHDSCMHVTNVYASDYFYASKHNTYLAWYLFILPLIHINHDYVGWNWSVDQFFYNHTLLTIACYFALSNPCFRYVG